MLDSLCLDMEQLLEGVTDDGLRHLDDDLIVMCYKASPEWISRMRRIMVVAKYVIVERHGDVSMEEKSSDEEDTESEDDESN